MKLVDMKIPKKSKKEREKVMTVGYDEGDKYPYGLQLRFNKDQIDKLPGMKDCKTGDTVNVVGSGKVTEVSMSESSSGRDRHNITIQIEKIDVGKKKALSEMSMAEYNKARAAGVKR